MTPKESAVAKSTGSQGEDEATDQDSALFRVLHLNKKIPKSEANFMIHTYAYARKDEPKCSKCKFNLGDLKILLAKGRWYASRRYCLGFYKEDRKKARS